LLRNISGVENSANGESDYRKLGDLEDAVHIAIPRDPIWASVRRIIKLDRDDRGKLRVANHEVDMLRFNVIEVRLPQQMAPIRFD
jgi:hypothetical protein